MPNLFHLSIGGGKLPDEHVQRLVSSKGIKIDDSDIDTDLAHKITGLLTHESLRIGNVERRFHFRQYISKGIGSDILQYFNEEIKKKVNDLILNAIGQQDVAILPDLSNLLLKKDNGSEIVCFRKDSYDARLIPADVLHEQLTGEESQLSEMYNQLVLTFKYIDSFNDLREEKYVALHTAESKLELEKNNIKKLKGRIREITIKLQRGNLGSKAKVLSSEREQAEKSLRQMESQFPKLEKRTKLPNKEAAYKPYKNFDVNSFFKDVNDLGSLETVLSNCRESLSKKFAINHPEQDFYSGLEEKTNISITSERLPTGLELWGKEKASSATQSFKSVLSDIGNFYERNKARIGFGAITAMLAFTALAVWLNRDNLVYSANKPKQDLSKIPISRQLNGGQPLGAEYNRLVNNVAAAQHSATQKMLETNPLYLTFGSNANILIKGNPHKISLIGSYKVIGHISEDMRSVLNMGPGCRIAYDGEMHIIRKTDMNIFPKIGITGITGQDNVGCLAGFGSQFSIIDSEHLTKKGDQFLVKYKRSAFMIEDQGSNKVKIKPFNPNPALDTELIRRINLNNGYMGFGEGVELVSKIPAGAPSYFVARGVGEGIDMIPGMIVDGVDIHGSKMRFNMNTFGTGDNAGLHIIGMEANGHKDFEPRFITDSAIYPIRDMFLQYEVDDNGLPQIRFGNFTPTLVKYLVGVGDSLHYKSAKNSPEFDLTLENISKYSCELATLFNVNINAIERINMVQGRNYCFIDFNPEMGWEVTGMKRGVPICDNMALNPDSLGAYLTNENGKSQLTIGSRDSDMSLSNEYNELGQMCYSLTPNIKLKKGDIISVRGSDKAGNKLDNSFDVHIERGELFYMSVQAENSSRPANKP